MTLDLLTAALVVFTALLFAATVYMGKEMRATRQLAIQPQLVLSLTMISKMVAAPVLTNIGAGAAVDVNLKLVYVPTAGGDDVARGWRTRLIVPGERHVFMPPLTTSGQAPTFANFAERYQSMRVVGSFRDRFGVEHQLDEAVDDLPAVQRLGAEAMHLYEGDALDRAAESLREPLAAIAQSADVLAHQVGQRAEQVPRQVRLRRAARHAVGLPDVTESGFVADESWGQEGRDRDARRQRVAKFRIGRAAQRWLA